MDRPLEIDSVSNVTFRGARSDIQISSTFECQVIEYTLHLYENYGFDDTIHVEGCAILNIVRASNSSVSDFTIKVNASVGIYLRDCLGITMSGIVAKGSSYGVYGVLVISSQNIQINFMNVHHFQNGLAISSSTFVTMENTSISDHANVGILVNSCVNTTMNNLFVSRNTFYGIKIINCYQTNLTNLIIEKNAKVALLLNNNEQQVFNNLSIRNNEGHGVVTFGNRKANITNMVLHKNLLGAHFTGDQQATLEGITIHETFIYLKSCEQLVVRHASINGSGQIVVEDSAVLSLEDTVISNVHSLFVAPEINMQGIIVALNQYILTVKNCFFFGNQVSSIVITDTVVVIEDTVVFENNSATVGGAFVLLGTSAVEFRGEGNIIFRNNHVTHYGAAFYVIPRSVFEWSIEIENLIYSIGIFSRTLVSSCFIYTQTPRPETVRLTFINNTAEKGGDVLYGKLVSTGYDGNWNCLLSFKNISDMTRQSIEQPFRRITSEPTRVCLCGERGPDCMIVVDTTHHHLYPGQTLTLTLAVVGQDFGTVYGIIYARLLKVGNDEGDVFMGNETEQTFEHGGCNNFSYTLFSNCDACETVLVLTTAKRPVTPETSSNINQKMKNTYSYLYSEPDYNKRAQEIIAKLTLYPSDNVFELSEEYHRVVNNTLPGLYTISGEYIQVPKVTNKLRFLNTIYKYPLYFNIKLHSCPVGFDLYHSQCDCVSLLKSEVTCDIQTSTISRNESIWVGLYDGKIVTITKYCPLNYCKNDLVKLVLSNNNSNGIDSQCMNNRGGILCGGCNAGLSVALGSEQCLKCSNEYITLILPFALAGVVVVLIIKMFDLTVCHGAINGIIFYANVISANRNLFYSQTNMNPLTLFIAWFNLDLGIETCFYDGLTAYARTWLQFVFPVYMWSIAGGIIIMARYSKRVAALLGNNGVPVLATLFLLSYAKLLKTIISALSYTTLYTTEGSKHVWSLDGNIAYLGPQHLPLFLAAAATFLFLWLPYTLLLLLGRYLNMIHCHTISRNLLRLKPFLDANYAPLHHRHHYWFGVTLLVKATVLLASATAPVNSDHILVFSFALSSAVLTFWGQIVYQRKSVALFHTSLFLNLTLLNISKLLVFDDITKISTASFTLAVVPFIMLTVNILSKVLGFAVKAMRCLRRIETEMEEVDIDLDEYRNESESESGEEGDEVPVNSY